MIWFVERYMKMENIKIENASNEDEKEKNIKEYEKKNILPLNKKNRD